MKPQKMDIKDDLSDSFGQVHIKKRKKNQIAEESIGKNDGDNMPIQINSEQMGGKKAKFEQTPRKQVEIRDIEDYQIKNIAVIEIKRLPKAFKQMKPKPSKLTTPLVNYKRDERLQEVGCSPQTINNVTKLVNSNKKMEQWINIRIANRYHEEISTQFTSIQSIFKQRF